MLTDRDPSTDSRATIVIAEDDVATRMVLRQVLSREHFRVVAVENGKLACEAVRREHPDLVVLDWLMPVMDGRAALEELKAGEDTRGIPVVMLSSHAAVDERISALDAGVQDYLSKPFDPRELVARIEQQLRWRRRLSVDADAAFIAERDALRAASERRYRLLAEAMPHVVWIAGPRGEMRYFNRAWYVYSGTPESAGPADWSTVVHPDDRAASARRWSASLLIAKPYEMQLRLRRAADGMYRWHLARAIPTIDEHGVVVEWVGSCSDIHDYKLAGETRTILDTMGSVVAIHGDDGFAEYVNPYWSEYTGASSDSALGFGWRDFVHPDDLAGAQREYDYAPSDEAARRSEVRIRGRDGAYRWFLTRATMLTHVSGAKRRQLVTSTDIDDLKRAQAALATSETRYRVLADSMPQLVWVTAGAAIEYVNERWSRYTGLPLAAAVAVNESGLIHPEDLATLHAMRSAPGETDCTCEVRFRRHDGIFRWHSVRAVPFVDSAGGAPKWIGTAMDIEETKAAAAALANTAAKLEHLAHHDAMTNLPNRVLLVSRLTEAIALAQRARAEVIVLYLDLNRFKAINDTLGHAAGDIVLTVTANRISGALRAGDTASRVGGDEFVLVCATNEATEDAARLANRLIDAIGEPIDVGGQYVTVGTAIGISMYPADGRSGEELIRKADSAMYGAKQSDQSAFQIYQAQTHSSIVAAMDFERELRAAIALRQIEVYFQPVVSLHTSRLVGAEALVRWRHPERGLLTPVDFLAFAEQHRLIGDVGAIVLDLVCAQIGALGTRVAPDFQISMNVSARQLTDAAWVGSVAAALARHAADPARLQIEIAENVVLSEATTVTSVLRDLRAMGVSLSIDDFGTGCSSLASIKTFPLQSLKIDRTFIENILTNASDQAVAKTIITLAHGLGLRAIATGVESREQIAALRSFGSDAYQGFIASRPMDPADFAAFLERHGTSTLSHL